MTPRLRRAGRAYRAYVRTSMAVSVQYRAGIFSAAAVMVVWVLLLTRVWTAVYHGRLTVAGFDLHTTVVYLTLANLQAAVINSPLSYVMAFRIRSGEVLFDVSRPIGYPGQMLALQAGQSLVQAAVVLLAAPLAGLAGGLSAPAGMAAGLTYPIALLLGWVLNALLALLVGLSAFWTVDNQGFATLFRFIAAFLAGASVPLAFFPGPLRLAADLLPFRFIVYQPAAVYVGQIRGPAIAGNLALAVAWIGVLAALVAVVWRRAYRRMVAHGG
jgi:ABC-2 type transport system permease protein